MRRIGAMIPLLVLFWSANPSFAQESPKPEAVVEKMVFKLLRGVTNIGTSIVEIPKQTYLSVRDRGDVGYVVGPLKGFGMGVYRLLIGGVETVFFMVPQPGYYDPIIDPEYVWNGWEERRVEPIAVTEPEQVPVKKGEPS